MRRVIVGAMVSTDGVLACVHGSGGGPKWTFVKRKLRMRPLLRVKPATLPLASRENRNVPGDPRKTSLVRGSSVAVPTLRRRSTSLPPATSMR